MAKCYCVGPQETGKGSQGHAIRLGTGDPEFLARGCAKLLIKGRKRRGKSRPPRNRHPQTTTASWPFLWAVFSRSRREERCRGVQSTHAHTSDDRGGKLRPIETNSNASGRGSCHCPSRARVSDVRTVSVLVIPHNSAEIWPWLLERFKNCGRTKRNGPAFGPVRCDQQRSARPKRDGRCA